MMRNWNVALLLMAALLFAAEGDMVKGELMNNKERIGAMRDLLLLQMRNGPGGVEMSGPLFDVKVASDGSSSVTVAGGDLASFDSDPFGTWYGTIGGTDGEFAQGSGSADGSSYIEVSGGDVAAVATDEEGNSDFVVNYGTEYRARGRIDANGDVVVTGPTLDVEIDGDMDGMVNPAGMGQSARKEAIPVELESQQNPYRDIPFGPQSAGQPDDTVVHHKPADSGIGQDAIEGLSRRPPPSDREESYPSGRDGEGTNEVGWLRDSLVSATGAVVSKNPPVGNTPSQVARGQLAGRFNAPDTYYSSAFKASRDTDVFEVEGDEDKSTPTTPLRFNGIDTM